MKLHLNLLEKLIDLPSPDPQELRALLDDVGLEVKGIDSSGGEGASIFTIETLANRGDHLSALGVARELSARLLCNVKNPTLATSLGDRKASLPVRIGTEKCSRYALLEMMLPESMPLRPEIAKVMASGEDASSNLASRHSIVHVLNYLLLELGQPMHAFDREKVEGEVAVALTTEPEEIEALDGVSYRVPAGSLVIRDRKRTIAVAGVIGCANSMVTPGTRRVLIESASFDPVTVRITARAMGISTDASYAFERGCDREMVLTALKRLVYLLGAGSGANEGGGAHVVGLTAVMGPDTEKRRLSFPLSLLRAQLNLARLGEAEVSSRLRYLGYEVVNTPSGTGKQKGDIILEDIENVRKSPGGTTHTTRKKEPKAISFRQPRSDNSSGAQYNFTVTVPSWRLWDVHSSQDLVEDFARSHGLNNIKSELPPLDYERPPVDIFASVRGAAEPILHGNGFFEVITRGFTSSEEVQLLGTLDAKLPARHLATINAVEGNNSHLKLTNVLHLTRLAAENIKRGVPSVKVYEFGRVFENTARDGGQYSFERDLCTIAYAGRWVDNEWRKHPSREEQLGHFRGTLESLAERFGERLSVGGSSHPLLHPGAQASIKFGRSIVGHFGLVHPSIRTALEAVPDVFYAELEVELLARYLERSRDLPLISDLPMIRRDLTFKLPAREVAGKIIQWAGEAKQEDLISIEIVDAFKKPDEEFRRITYRFTFQSPDRTLSHQEVDARTGAITNYLSSRYQIDVAG